MMRAHDFFDGRALFLFPKNPLFLLQNTVEHVTMHIN